MPPACLGPVFLAGLSAFKDSATSAQTIKFAFPEHLPCDYRDPTLSPWYEHAQNWEAKPLGPMTQLSGLPWNLVLDSQSPSNLSSMRIIWDMHPLQLHGQPLTTLKYHSPHKRLVEGEVAFPGVLGPVFRTSNLPGA